MANRSRKKRGPMVRIADPEQLQALLTEIVEECQSVREAADYLGLHTDTFENLLAGRVRDAMTTTTYERILTALGCEERPAKRPVPPAPFGSSPQPPVVGDGAVFVGEEFLVGEVASASVVNDDEARAIHDRCERFIESLVSVDDDYAWSNYSEWLARELRRIRPRAEPIVRALWDSGHRRRFSNFLTKVGRSNSELPEEVDLRCWLALCRAVEPLADATDTWGIERTWAELDTAEELKAYLKAALKREELLLKPTDDQTRVRRAQPPEGFWQAMERIAAQDAFFEANPGATMGDWNALDPDPDCVE